MLPANTMWLGIDSRATALKLPASWPPTPIVTASRQDGRSHVSLVCVLRRISSLCSLIFLLSFPEIGATESPHRVALSYNNSHSRQMCLRNLSFETSLQKKAQRKLVKQPLFIMVVLFGNEGGLLICSSFTICSTKQSWAAILLFSADMPPSICIQKCNMPWILLEGK